MEIRYNVTGSRRKALAEAIGEMLAQDIVYKGTPTYNYEIGNCIVDKNGTLTFTDDVTDEAASLLIESLKELGYEAETADNGDVNEDNTLTVEIPKESLSDEAIERLRQIIASKETLIKKAIGANSLLVEVSEEKLCFPWFTLSDADGEADAYTRFVAALCDMAKRQKRVIAKERDLENEKFAMRVFLIRLGFIGDEYKQARKILNSRLTGNSSWKSGPPMKEPAVLAESDEVGNEAETTSENDDEVAATDEPVESTSEADKELVEEILATLEQEVTEKE